MHKEKFDLRRATRELLFPSVEALWTFAFHLARRLPSGHDAPRSWQPGGRVLVVAPHPDDETLGAGGVMALHRQHDDPVTIAVITDGSGSRASGLSPQSMARRRSKEALSAIRALGISDVRLFDLPEGCWDTGHMQEKLAPLVGKADIIYAPSCVDFHPEHLRVARHLAEMVRQAQTVRVYELSVPLTPLLANVVADIASVAAQKRQALACFATQEAALAAPERLARYRGVLYGVAHAEVFWEMPAYAYKRVMRYGAWGWQETPFRGLRSRPFGDPLAFLTGRRARRRLRLLAQDREA